MQVHLLFPWARHLAGCPTFLWKTGGPVFLRKRGLVARRASNCKTKTILYKYRSFAVATPNREKLKDKKVEEVKIDQLQTFNSKVDSKERNALESK